MSNLNYQEKIPNNVDLSNDLSLQRALEHWQPKFKSWWNDMGPDGFQSYDVYLSCLLYTSPSPRDMRRSRMPSSA